MKTDLAKFIADAIEQARYPERFDVEGKPLARKATAYRPARAASWQTARKPHATERDRLSAMLELACTLAEHTNALTSACIEVAQAMKAAESAIVKGSLDDLDRVHRLMPADRESCVTYAPEDWTPCHAEPNEHGGSSVEIERVTCLACLEYRGV